MGKNQNKHFTKDIQMTNKHEKRCSTLYVIRESQIKTMRHYLYSDIPIRIAKNKNFKPDHTMATEDEE